MYIYIHIYSIILSISGIYGYISYSIEQGKSPMCMRAPSTHDIYSDSNHKFGQVVIKTT